MTFLDRIYGSTIGGALIVVGLLQASSALAMDKMPDHLASAQSAHQIEGVEEKRAPAFSGNVSWYGPQFQGKKTASGEMFDMNKATAAHRSLSFGTRVLVEDPRTGRSVIVKVNDRGPYVGGRVMDLAREGARQLGTLGMGVIFADCLILTPSLRQPNKT